MKKCTKCGIEKEESEFYKSQTGHNGLSSHCKICDNIHCHNWYLNNKDHHRKYCKEYEIKNYDKIRKHKKEYVKNHPELRKLKYQRYKKLHSHKLLARALIANYIKKGKLIRPDNCSYCRIKCIPHGHHSDYSKKLEVIWLCNLCHKNLHLKEKQNVCA